MRRLITGIVLAAIAGLGVGCLNVERIGCESRIFYLDLQRNVFGIDYPHGAPEFERQPYYGIPGASMRPICMD